MVWNILHGANDIPDGIEHAIEIIKTINPDVILMIETYGSGKKIADALGYNFHLIAPEGTLLDNKEINLSIFSKFPFGDRIDTDYPFYLGGREIIIADQRIRFCTNWFHYLPWNNSPETMGLTSEELLDWEKTGPRFEMIQKVLPYVKHYASQTDSIPLIVGGDFNSPSHLDWGLETKSRHNKLIVPWYSTRLLEDLGMMDSYRTVHPNPLTHPGITWDTKEQKDEHRIDYIYFKGNSLKALKSDSYKTFLGDSLTINNRKIPYPSDHGIVVTTFQLEK
ncbi:endonuclease/exonuclease/phosphatase family protein [Aestuariivivens sediminis]|uniref:endonuclease/exonuclease/phosphatase family protein n=1 Tax=Aestuariivivens sediminis TaxID=2913557 RepID=UPI001F575D48|nr:endonuclease/exonuclease/phosphatase family protein [Aestuariivivens sediminis]